jgi:hypothetical protein
VQLGEHCSARSAASPARVGKYFRTEALQTHRRHCNDVEIVLDSLDLIATGNLTNLATKTKKLVDRNVDSARGEQLRGINAS